MTRHRTPGWAAVLPATLLLAGCAAVGPAYVAPKPEAPAVFPSAAALAPRAVSADPAGWWRGLGDPDLSAAVERALAANPSLDIAAARVAQARASLAGVRALQSPIGEVGVAAGHGQDSRLSPEGRLLSAFGAATESDLFGGVASVGWETDLFGAVRRGVEARGALVEAQADQADAVRVVVAAETARAYSMLRGLQIRRAILDERLACADRQLLLARRRAAEGRSSMVDVRRGEAELAAIRMAAPQFDTAITAALNALDTLQARPLGASRSLLDAPARLPQAVVAQVLDSPAEAVSRRPDVRAAERAVAAANAGIGVAVAEYYPSVRLDALAGLSSTQAQHLLENDAGLWLGFASLRWRLLDWKRIDADVALATGRKAEALAVYRRTAFAAASEIDTAMARLHGAAEAVRQGQELISAAERAETLASRAHAEGAVALTPVLEARSRRLAAEDELATARLEAVTASIDLYRALGGLGRV